ncbi:MAG: FtsX-like permease family protein [Bacteroidota bacterium]
MNFEFFTARKIAAAGQRSFSRLIIRLAVIAVALSMTVMIVATALIAGFKNEISDKIFGFWGHIHITDANLTRSFLDQFPIPQDQPFYPFIDTIEEISFKAPFRIGNLEFPNRMVDYPSQGGINHVQVYALIPGIIETKEEIEGIILKGIGKDFNWEFLNQYLQEGEPLEWQDSTASSGILISRQTADRLNVSVGDKFIVYFVQEQQLRRAFTIKGIYKTGLEEYDQKFALVDIRKIQQLLKWEEDQVAGFEVFIDDINDLDLFTEYIYLEELPNDLYAENIREKFPNIFEWLELQDINEQVILALMLVVGIINMMTALLILILERTNMIGILKALGSTNWSVRKIFLYYAGYILVIGLFWGNLIGLALCILQKQFSFIRLSEADYYLSVAPIELNFWTILGLNLLTMIITLISLVLPSFLVSRIDPVRAIRFK